MKGYINKGLAAAKQLTGKTITVALLTGAVAVSIGCVSASTNTICIVDGGREQVVYTAKDDPETILSEHGYTVRDEDKISFSLANNQGRLTIDRAFAVTVCCGGEETVVMTTGGRVADILVLAGIALEEMDQVSPALDVTITQEGRITIDRQEKRTVTKQVELAYATETISTSLLANGRERVLVEGRNGVSIAVYEQMIVNGEEQEPVLVEETVQTEPVTRQVLIGKAGEPVSKLDFGYTLDTNGEPTTYKRVLRAQRAAGYSAEEGARTATGDLAAVGYVAVDPNVIPYGSKLYIKSADGSFVYGYAIASDTGTALRDGIVDVDLFYDTRLESKLNELRAVDIFILE